jgi:predicted transcriptional regulator of viral defense system
MLAQPTQKAKLVSFLNNRGMARAGELREQGIEATTISRAVKAGDIEQVARGLYQMPGTDVDLHRSLIEASQQAPKGVIAMQTALAFHDLTDQMPRKIWIAIAKHDWAPQISYPPTRIIRFTQVYFENGIEHHEISGVRVPVYSIAKTLADLFRNTKISDRSVAIEGLRKALSQKKISPAAIARAARENGAWKQMQPYLEAMTSYD